MKEIELRGHFFEDNDKITSIYFGGGTPSLASNKDLDAIVIKLQQSFHVTADAEITLEINPEDVTTTQLSSWHDIGVNRLSIGLQSFVSEDLNYMNRAHTAEQTLRAIQEVAKQYDDYSVDLIFGSPYLSNKQLENNLKTILTYAPPHISCYALTIEPRTALFVQIKKGKCIAPNDVRMAEQFNLIQSILKGCGYEHYEISNYCLPGYRAKHNSSYWRRESYLGLGPGAHSYIGNRRSWNIANNVKYITAIQRNELAETFEELSEIDVVNEQIMIGLRTIEGIDRSLVDRSLNQQQRIEFQKTLDQYLQDGKLTVSNGKITTTSFGRHYADGIAADLFITD